MKTCFKKIKHCIFLILLALCVAGCDNYERKGEVTPEITVNEHSLNMFVGETALLKASPTELKFAWTSDDSDVAAVDDNGLVTATGDGTTNIIAHSGDMTCSVPVTAITRIHLIGFSLSAASIELAPANRVELWATFDPPDANDASLPLWRSLNTEIATVDYRGFVTGVSIGTTEVVCTINGMDKSVNVTVK